MSERLFGILTAALISCVLTYGCAASIANAMPGEGVEYDDAARWGCAWSELQSQIEYKKSTLKSGRIWVPQVGWGMCEVLASVGVPWEVDIQSGYGSTSYTLWYGDGLNEDMKMLRVDADTNLVEYVSW